MIDPGLIHFWPRDYTDGRITWWAVQERDWRTCGCDICKKRRRERLTAQASAPPTPPTPPASR